jgi:aminoglycoside phosphotransferase (APT) family kinase protein
MPTWTPEVEVDELLVRRLLGAQFPELALRSVRALADGWDSSVYLVDDEWAFRFPRRAMVLPGLAAELAVLPRLAPLLPVAVPLPVFVGSPDGDFPWLFAGARLIPGQEATGVGGRAALASALGSVLRALHAPATLAAVGELREDANRRGDMQLRVPFARERLRELAAAGAWTPPPAVDRILEAALELPPPRASAVCHGDLHFRHLIVAGGELRGLIDWIDVCRADPAIDLQLVWSFFDPQERVAFAAEYGELSRETLLRGRVVALFLCAMLALYGAAEGHEAIVREALDGLERTLVDDAL